jgi:hypothetical protein
MAQKPVNIPVWTEKAIFGKVLALKLELLVRGIPYE